MKMQAAVLRGFDLKYQIEDLDIAEPGPGQIRVRIAGVGLCHTDTLPRVPDLTAGPPIIPGHEGSGVVESIGPGVADLDVGDHVVLSYDSCGRCQNCLSSHPAYCETFMPRNLSGVGLDAEGPVTDSDGKPVAARWFGQSSFATHSIVDAVNAVKVSKDLPIELLGPLGCGVQTGAGAILVALDVRAGSSVVIFGAGGVGLSAVMAARVAGATTIVAVDLHRSRLDLAAELGATHTVDGTDTDILETLIAITGGGAQYSLDTTGVPAVISTAISCLRPTGTCGLVGVQLGDVSLGPMDLAIGRTVTGILEGDAVPGILIPRLIELWRQGRFPFDRLIKKFPLDQINEAEQASLRGDVVKPVLIPS